MMTDANPFFLPVWEFRLSFVYIGKNAGKCLVSGKGPTKVHGGGAYFNLITRLSRPSSIFQAELWPLKKLYSTSNSQQVLFGPYLVMFFGNEPLQKCSSSNEFIRVGPHPLWQVSSQKGEPLDTGTDTHRGKVMYRDRQNARWRLQLCYRSQGMSSGTISWKKQGGTLSQVSKGAWLCWHLDFKPLVPSTVKQHISVVLSQPVCGTLL